MKLPESSHNWITLIGAMIALISLFMIIFLFVITAITQQQASYIGLVIYILLPAIMIAGMILIPIGMFWQRRRMKKSGAIGKMEWPRVDLNDVRYRNAFFIFVIGTVIFLFLSAIGSYEAFNYTESVEFCGTVCHSVMEPEYTAYQNSPHARVACVDCHVGSGADWYVRSKLSGLYQVYAVIANVYPHPIPTPIKDLRPARETCEECHWPQKFYSKTLRIERHHLTDELNTAWDIHLNMKIGADYSALGLIEGIHWHINPDVKIEYYASDQRNEEIPWVRYSDLKTGEQTVYIDQDNSIDNSEIPVDQIRTMDCMDCHNRPSHSYKPPAFFINEAMTAGLIPDELPEIKSLAMEICAEELPSSDSAMAYIQATLLEYYSTNYSELTENKAELIEKAIAGLQKVYSENIFPDMKVRWSAYPNHIGHLEFNGCFRCHNDRHTNATGHVIAKDCNRCHLIIAQGIPGNLEYASFGNPLDFKHPVDIDQAWQEGLCTDCHTGLNP